MLYRTMCLLLSLVLLVALVSGCGQTDSGRKMTVSCVCTGSQMDSQVFPQELVDNAYELQYTQVTNVQVTLGSKTVPLEDALRDGSVTVDGLIALARADAAAEQCQEAVQSQHGVSRFIYTYSDVELTYTCDVYETPDGGQCLIREFQVCAPGMGEPQSCYYFDQNSPFAYSLDREDWGLTTEIQEVSPTGLTVSLSAGQQQTLTVTEYQLFHAEDYSMVGGVTWESQAVFAVPTGGAAAMTLDWQQDYGTLKPGAYMLRLHIVDRYDPDTPLTEGDYKQQSYYLLFEIL